MKVKLEEKAAIQLLTKRSTENTQIGSRQGDTWRHTSIKKRTQMGSQGVT